ncbi:hypothetical protein PF005_g23350 [Phytophthora fragariae]|uniref:Secreted protein n=1 Tax=Phytophthora fragariae TaxID=53985 RepID=A0A6A3WYH3_9STRA|nr:hypothetical protein PF003_g3458 [Phytophthora fragariae]KAE8926111.1 hypothetical protein PF009_g23695 [Phytophthora fragariae]KAE8981838.1 hypothetical protein PF011_g21868 [Phytophthora fragariae]KAE9080083.1 hypothetical protein PF010_g22515 [Phytophthora fragariae]KAE9080765.1 hypothetical protein PF007_g22916 [Phytophthora fragariae]
MHRSLMLTFFSLVSSPSIDAFTRARYAGRGATSTALPVPLRRPSCFEAILRICAHLSYVPPPLKPCGC